MLSIPPPQPGRDGVAFEIWTDWVGEAISRGGLLPAGEFVPRRRITRWGWLVGLVHSPQGGRLLGGCRL